MRTLALTLLLGLCGALALTPVEQARVKVLVRSYPQQLVGMEGDRLIWKDGTRMPLARSGARDYVGRLNTAGLLDQLDARYPACSSLHVPAHNEDIHQTAGCGSFKSPRDGIFLGSLCSLAYERSGVLLGVRTIVNVLVVHEKEVPDCL